MNPEERAGFLAAILNEPTDDMARGAYADALRESDDPFDQLHGRFIWAGLALSKFRGLEPVGDGMFFDAIREQSEAGDRVLMVQVAHLVGWDWGNCAWTNDDAAPDRVTVGAIQAPVEGETRLQRRSRRRNAAPNAAVIWERGCVAGLRLTLRRAWEVAPYVLAACPLEWIEVIDVPGLRFEVVREEGFGWRVRAALQMQRRVVFETATTPRVDLPPQCLTRQHPFLSFDVFPTREHLLRQVENSTNLLVAWLRDQAGDRWPGPREGT